jgi:hypothetical protein
MAITKANNSSSNSSSSRRPHRPHRNRRNRTTSTESESEFESGTGSSSDSGRSYYLALKLVAIIGIVCYSCRNLLMSYTNDITTMGLEQQAKFDLPRPIVGNNINIIDDKNNSINSKDNVTLRSSSSLSSTTTNRSSSLSSLLLRDPTPINQDQPIPAAFVYTKELYPFISKGTTPDDNDNRKKKKKKKKKKNTKQNILQNTTNSSTIVMNPEVYGQLTNQIFRIKQARKPLLIMINSHPCAGKSFFIHNHTEKFMGCNLLDHDQLNQKKYPGATPDSSYLMRIQQDNVIKGIVTNNTALLGSSAIGKLAKKEKYDDVIYIHVITPLTVVERNLKGRLEEGERIGRWSKLEEVIKRRQKSLFFAIKDEVLVEPLFATFQEGLEFCINTYNTYNNTDDMYI